MLGPTAASWAARLGLLHLEGTSLAFMNYRYTALILTVLAVGELVADKLPFMSSRKAPPSFIFRIASGALTGATVGASVHSLVGCAVLGAVGGVTGTMGGSEFRARLAALFGRDLPAALLEDLCALLLVALCLFALRNA